jgi:HAE1 family hydrophobic/amphiphilic exporter-1
MYQQFALTIAISVLLSAFSALSLSPALSVMLLKPGHGPGRGPLGAFFRGFNWVFDRATTGYIGVARLLVRRSVITILLVGVVAVGAGLFGRALPAGFIPDEDQGLLGVNVQLPPGASLERTSAILSRVEEIVGKAEGVDAYTTIGGFGLVTNTYQPNFGTVLIRLKDWEERHDPAQHVSGIIARLAPQFAAIPEAVIFPFNIPTISGFGASAGFNMLLQDRSGTLSVEDLGGQVRTFLAEARQRPELANLFTSFDPNYPQVKVELDREKARTLGVPINDVFQAMSAVLGGAYVNDFNRFGRLFRVYVQADADYRRKPDDIGQIYVRSQTTNTMIPLSTMVTIREVPSTEITTRFNLFRSVEISGVPARGYTSGQALAALEDVFAKTMPKEMGVAYSKLSYQEKVAPPAGPTFALAIIFVFLLLAALYESWRLPWAVLLGSPLVALGAFFGVWLAGYDNNVYVQIGLIMLIGLAAKNAILIVEVAKMRHEEGHPVQESALDAARLRFRPILMTAFAFILGVVPLMRASGAGAGAQNVMGTAVFWGMLVATALGVFVIPGNFAFVEQLGRRHKRAKGAAPIPAHEPAPPPALREEHP